jgi:hypothetical protein
MSCLSIGFLEQSLIGVVILVTFIAVIRALVPWATSKLGKDFAVVGVVVNLVLWAAVVIYAIQIAFALLAGSATVLHSGYSTWKPL